MPTIRMKVRYSATVCPNCDAEIMSGIRRFGPAQVQCYNCKSVLQTGLTSWADLSPQQKRRMVLSELLAPSWNRPIRAFLGNLMAWVWVSGMLLLIPGAFLFAYGYGKAWQDPALTALLIVTIVAGFLLVPVRRLRRLIRESNRYDETGEPPVWRKPALLRRQGQ